MSRAPASRRAAGAASAVAALAAAAMVARRRSQLRTVAPELRSPALYVPFSLTSDRAVRMVQALSIRAAAAMPPPDGVDVAEEIVGDRGVRVLLYRPAESDSADRRGALVWIHGGGYVIGTPEQDHDLCARFVRELGIVVVSVDYRLAPDHPFPAGLEDCDAALAWTHERADELGVDPARVAVGGASAGGGMAARLAQLAHDRGGPPVCFQLLQYPMLDDTTTVGAAHTPVWSAASNRYAWDAYVGQPLDGQGELGYAAAAARADLEGLPATWIGVGDADLFHDECLAYATRLEDAGVAVEVHVVPGMYHAADRLVPRAASMQDFTDRMVRAVGEVVAGFDPAVARGPLR